MEQGMALPTRDGNVDVEVHDDEGQRWSATFFTVENVSSLLARWKDSGEHCGGLYFWCPDGVLVDVLDRDVIEKAVADLAKSGALPHAFTLLEE
jgi:hypothetical protein